MEARGGALNAGRPFVYKKQDGTNTLQVEKQRLERTTKAEIQHERAQ